MKFIVERTSIWGNDKPYEKCKLETVDRTEIRTLRTPEEFDAKFSDREGKWLSRGVDHCIDERGYIKRTHKNDINVWTIEINTLEELIALKDEVGERLILTTDYNSGLIGLEIYDDYRE